MCVWVFLFSLVFIPLVRCYIQEGVMNESWFIIFCWLRFCDNWLAFIWKAWAISPACFPPVSKVCFELVVWALFYSLRWNVAETYRRLDKCFTSDCFIQQHNRFVLSIYAWSQIRCPDQVLIFRFHIFIQRFCIYLVHLYLQNF